jgi:hypothetical protein
MNWEGNASCRHLWANDDKRGLRCACGAWWPGHWLAEPLNPPKAMEKADALAATPDPDTVV